MRSTPSAETSIQRRLLRWLLIPLAVVLLATALLGYPIALYPATAVYDWALLDSAHSLARLIATTQGGLKGELPPAADTVLRTDQFDRIYYSVHDLDGRLIAGDRQLPPPAHELLPAGDLLYDSRIAGEQVRVAALLVAHPGGQAVVQVAETTVKRRRLAQQILTGVFFVEFLLLASVVVLVWFGIGKGLEPLQRLQREIGARSHRDLRPVPDSETPSELRSVVRALNSLLADLETALRSQQRFIANAAHQLRTPLAGLRAQVEYGLQQDDPREWRCTLRTLAAATGRAARLANQLLTLAKAEAGTREPEAMPPIDLRSVIERVAEEWMPKAIEKDIDLGLELGPASVRGDDLLIGEMLANLVDNAVGYTPAGGRVTVRSLVRGGHTVLEVEDDGPGIPEEERAKVFQRFHRGVHPAKEGSGLGLAIVQEIAHVHRGEVEIRSGHGGRGTLVVVRFPAPKKPPPEDAGPGTRDR